ncbi:hypothetical protein D3C87_1587780 [compost metagenome]
MASAPDCVANASLPGNAMAWAKLALRPIFGTIRPTQLGPSMRSSHGRAASSMACWWVIPVSASGLDMPALRTTAARQPRRPSSAMMAGIVAGGVQMTARSGHAGSSSTAA